MSKKEMLTGENLIISKRIVKVLFRYMIKNNLSQAEVARRLKMNLSNLNRCMNNKSLPSLSNFLRIMELTQSQMINFLEK